MPQFADKPGLIDFSPTKETATTLGTMQIAQGTVLKNIKFVIATVPSLCNGANYAVRFNPGSGDIDVTQDTSFKFNFGSSGLTITGSETVTLYAGNIVNSMVALCAGLDNSSIQTVDAGQAQ